LRRMQYALTFFGFVPGSRPADHRPSRIEDRG
jgi:hypothetical protein